MILYIIISIILFIITTLLVVKVFLVHKKNARVATPDSPKEDLYGKLIELQTSLNEAVVDPLLFSSKAQFESVCDQFDELSAAIQTERDRLTLLEGDLDKAQEEVEEREVRVQEQKGSKDEEAKYLEQISREFELLSQESEALENNLQDSLKELSMITSQIEMTREQAKTFSDFQKLIQESLDRLKELTVEGQEVERRLKVLSQQYRNLEDEYTKLVEQQFA